MESNKLNKCKWGQKEISLVKRHYLSKTKDEMLTLLPNRTWDAIKIIASKQKVSKLKKWTKQEIDFLKKNYKKHPTKWCANQIGKSVGTVVAKAGSLNLYTYKHALSINKIKNVNADSFLNIKAPEAAYILGFLWADGYVSANEKYVSLNIIKKDLNKIKKLFSFLGKWNFTNKKTSSKDGVKRQPQTTAYIHNEQFNSFLIENDYHKKSILSPDKIFSKIPKQISSYFIRGMVDGDGCFYVSKNGRTRQFKLAGTFEQDWSLIEKLFIENNITYKVERNTQINKINNKLNKSSVVRVWKRESIINLSKLLYGDNLYFDFGLKRKYDKCMDILLTYNKH